MAKKAVESGLVEMLLFSINPAFDMHPATGDLDTYFAWEDYQADLGGIDPQRAELYRLCEQHDVGITVMKLYAGGWLFDAKRSPFGAALTPVNIDIAMVNQYYDLASMQPELPETVRAHYEALEHHGDECIGCKHCEARWPFGVRIAERMGRAAELFRLRS